MRVANVKNIHLRRACIVALYVLTVPIALALLVMIAFWGSIFAIREAVGEVWRKEFTDEVSDLHRNLAKIWRSGQ
jgi:hypothetical protein